MAREDLNPVDEARACAALVEELGLSKEELARRLGRSRPAISNLIRLLDLPDEVLELLAAGELSEGHGRAILQARGRRRAPRARPRGRRARLVGPRDRAPGQGGRRRKRRRRSSRTPTRRRRWRAPRRRSRRRSGTGVRVRAARRGIRAELHFDDLDELLAFAAPARRGASS